ncbi:MAG: hypothetical protein AB1468_06540 [Candidatus Micrarchaeota archaeon]
MELLGVPAHVLERALEEGLAGSRNDVIRQALVLYGEKLGLLDNEGPLSEEVSKAIDAAGSEKSISHKEVKKRLGL